MSARSAWVAAVVVLLAAPVAGASGKPLFAEPEDGPDPRGLTLYGSGLARVAPPSRLTEQTIARAVDAARPTAQLRALHDARRRARSLAKAAGLTLGSVRAATDRLPDLERFAGGARHCHPGRRRGAAARLRCRVPDFASASLRVTFATLETSAVVPTRRAIAASASADAPVRPRHRTSPAIRAALGRAQLVADPLALAGAARRAAAPPGPRDLGSDRCSPSPRSRARRSWATSSPAASAPGASAGDPALFGSGAIP